MLGFAEANKHLLPQIQTKKDMAKVFGDVDPLAPQRQDEREKRVQKQRDLGKQIVDMLAEPEQYAKEVTQILQDYYADQINSRQSALTTKQKRNLAKICLRLLDANKLQPGQVGLAIRFAFFTLDGEGSDKLDSEVLEDLFSIL